METKKEYICNSAYGETHYLSSIYFPSLCRANQSLAKAMCKYGVKIKSKIMARLPRGFNT